jgi:uncharacterized protein YqjF (DUF2071 family)
MGPTIPRSISHEPADKLVVAYMQWRDLVYLHWPVPLDKLGPLIPPELTLDTWKGVAWVSIVAFDMTMRGRLFPSPLSLTMPEINVRTYVRYKDEEPGLYFLSLDIDSWLATAGARTLLGLPYFPAHIDYGEQDREIMFRCQRTVGTPAHFATRVRPGRTLGASKPGTLPHFLLERYALYVERPGVLLRVQVQHAPLSAQKAEVCELDTDLIAADGLPQPQGQPRLAHYVPFADVEVYRPELVAMRETVIVPEPSTSSSSS